MFTSQYPRNSLGHILAALRHRGIPETIAGSVTAGNGMIRDHGELFANYKYFDGIEQPLFRFQNHVFDLHRHCIVDGEDGKKKLEMHYHLSLGNNDLPSLIVHGWDASQDLRSFIEGTMLTIDMRYPGYKLTKDSGAFFQGGYNAEPDSENGWIFIEFWKPEGAQAWIDHLNANFKRQLPEGFR